MRARVLSFVALLLFLADGTARTTEPMANFDNMPITMVGGAAPSLAEVRGAIISAGALHRD